MSLFEPVFWWTFVAALYLVSFSLLMTFFLGAAQVNERADELTEELIRRLRRGDYNRVSTAA